jgi:uncharacterized membrane protein (DUF485 family)
MEICRILNGLDVTVFIVLYFGKILLGTYTHNFLQKKEKSLIGNFIFQLGIFKFIINLLLAYQVQQGIYRSIL